MRQRKRETWTKKERLRDKKESKRKKRRVTGTNTYFEEKELKYESEKKNEPDQRGLV